MDFTNGSQKAGEQIFGFNMLLLSCALTGAPHDF